MPSKKSLERPPRTIIEVYQSLPEGMLAELIDNVLYRSPSRVSLHQMVLNEINFQLMQFFKIQGTGAVFISPLDVYLDESSNAVQPDIIVVLNPSRHIVREEGHIHGVPDLLIEILSPSNKEYDLVKKKALYERFGVKEYWAIDPESKLALGYIWEDQKYKLTGEDVGLIKFDLLNLHIRF